MKMIALAPIVPRLREKILLYPRRRTQKIVRIAGLAPEKHHRRLYYNVLRLKKHKKTFVKVLNFDKGLSYSLGFGI